MSIPTLLARLCCLIFIATFARAGTASEPAATADRPNFLIILADDMGYGDLGFTGSEFLQTPHLDQLARSGVFCEQGYVASPVCSPSRAGLLTGRDPRRFGYEGNLNRDDQNTTRAALNCWGWRRESTPWETTSERRGTRLR